MSLSKVLTNLCAASALLLLMAANSVTYAQSPNENTFKNLTLCTGVDFGGTCIDVPAFGCVNLVGGLTVLNNEISSAVVPARINCTLFSAFGCLTVNSADSGAVGQITLPSGSYPNFFEITVDGEPGSVAFNDETSSFVCVNATST
ncbi:hypothetical protein VKT23_019810 [Stygiomarasmius scandens]|uniref:Uncharacterized protein n=1 Tax=Marasmiellus scandens TaxID=2682957 RepID=A0ABR1IKD5_9AGAR